MDLLSALLGVPKTVFLPSISIDHEEMNKRAAIVEVKLNSLRVRLSDYCEEKLLETKPSPQVMESRGAGSVFAPEQTFSDRAEAVQKKGRASTSIQNASINEYIDKAYTGIVINKVTPKKNYINTIGPIKATGKKFS